MKMKNLLSRFGVVITSAAIACSAALSVSAAMVAVDMSKTASLSLYKYDFTSASEAGVDTSSYVSTGLKDDAVEASLAPYAIQGVEFSYLKVADLETHTENEGSVHKDIVLYKMMKDTKTDQLLTAFGLEAGDAYKVNTDALYFTSDTLIHALSEQLTANETSTKNTLEAFVKNNGGSAMPETDAAGHSAVDSLPFGLYLLAETRVPENVTDTTAPFLVSMPSTTITGDSWNYDVTVYPKNDTGSPTLEKTLRESQEDTGKHNGSTHDIGDGYAHTGTASDGDVINYQILSTLPTITSDATALTAYTYTDTLSKGVEYKKSDVAIEWFKDAACTDLVAVWTEQDTPSKFDVTYGTADDAATTMTISITDAGLKEINTSSAVYDAAIEQVRRGYSNLTMRVTYSAVINSSADVAYGDSGNPNTVELLWKRTNMTYYDTLNDDCHLYVYGVDLTKEFSDGNGDFANVKFRMHNDTDDYFVVAELDTDAGVYYVTDHQAAEADATVFTPSASGKIIAMGLEDDTYTLTEIATDDGYALLKDDIEVKITSAESGVLCPVCEKSALTATATVNGDDVEMLENNGSLHATVPLTVVNTHGFDFPKTGDTGTGIFTVAGAVITVLSGAAVIMLFVLRRKNQSDR